MEFFNYIYKKIIMTQKDFENEHTRETRLLVDKKNQKKEHNMKKNYIHFFILI
jgi:hypothetical protein